MYIYTCTLKHYKCSHNRIVEFPKEATFEYCLALRLSLYTKQSFNEGNLKVIYTYSYNIS